MLPFVSPPTRLLAADSKVTKRPSPEIFGRLLPPFAGFRGPGADSSRLVVLAVADEDVGYPVRVAGNQIACVGQEGDEAAGARDVRDLTRPVSLGAVGPDTHPPRLARLAVAHKNIGCAAGVQPDEVGGTGVEGHVPSGLRNRGEGAGGIRLSGEAFCGGLTGRFPGSP